ncbi:Ribonuclease BN [bacterium HR07]|uniref:Metal dependent hydrolase n=1 Tax=Acetithermum autotrophicum TaxID=1446466 RepID=H5SRA8_ACEAU|nr:metal dependent hydrolase [Candidatus Acetothermum autotrophicum]GBC76420.1 Ribonuclease BN [bacterium HR07]
MRLTILGTAGVVPDAQRVQSGYLLEKAGRLVLIDCGSGVFSRLAHLAIDWARLDTFVLTHLHLDHMSDLLSIWTARWLMGAPEVTLYGPQGTREFITKLLDLFPYIRDHIRVTVHELKAGETLWVAGCEVATLAMNHYVPTLAYKFDNTVVICGDSEPQEELVDFARGCKVLIHECSFPDGTLAPLHATPTALGEILAYADVEWLVLTHLYPQAAAQPEELIRAVQKNFPKKVTVATDLEVIDL